MTVPINPYIRNTMRLLLLLPFTVRVFGIYYHTDPRPATRGRVRAFEPGTRARTRKFENSKKKKKRKKCNAAYEPTRERVAAFTSPPTRRTRKILYAKRACNDIFCRIVKPISDVADVARSPAADNYCFYDSLSRSLITVIPLLRRVSHHDTSMLR